MAVPMDPVAQVVQVFQVYLEHHKVQESQGNPVCEVIIRDFVSSLYSLQTLLTSPISIRINTLIPGIPI